MEQLMLEVTKCSGRWHDFRERAKNFVEQAQSEGDLRRAALWCASASDTILDGGVKHTAASFSSRSSFSAIMARFNILARRPGDHPWCVLIVVVAP